MEGIRKYHFNHPEGYVAVYTNETVRKMSARPSGRPFIRFNIVERGSEEDKVVISNINAAALQEYQDMAKSQGNYIYRLPTNPDNIGETGGEISIKTLRERTGFTQAEFGRFAFGISSSTIQNWETGQRNCPDYIVKLIEYKLKKENIIP